MRLLLGLFLAAALSLPIGLGVSEIASLMPCQGEGLACNLDEAIGGYAVIIWSLLGPVIFGVILFVASNRVTLLAGMLLLLPPLLAFLGIALVESWQAFGLEPYPNVRTTLTLFVPGALAVLAQWKILSVVLARAQARSVKPLTTE